MKASDFVLQRISKSAVIQLNAPIEQVFPLFGALREKDWAAGWDPEVLYSESGEIEERMVFRTSSAHGHAEGLYTWLVSKYLPDQATVEYTVFTAERVWWISIRCWEEAPQSTKAEVTYTWNGLTDAGNHLNRAASERLYAEDLRDWERAINHSLVTGKTLM